MQMRLRAALAFAFMTALGAPASSAVVYVSSLGSDEVLRFDENGAQLGAWGACA